jgi:hypothetical protein
MSLWLAFVAGILSAGDAMAIKLMLPQWQHDVLSSLHARRIQRDARV